MAKELVDRIKELEKKVKEQAHEIERNKNNLGVLDRRTKKMIRHIERVAAGSDAAYELAHEAVFDMGG